MLVVFLLICLILGFYFRLLFLLAKLERFVKAYHRSYDSLVSKLDADLDRLEKKVEKLSHS